MQRQDDRSRLAELGNVLGPEVLAATQDIFRARQQALADSHPPAAADLAYGSDPRQLLDLYRPAGGGGSAPVLIWVHGGGFVGGAKRSDQHPFGAHVGRWAARHGLLGAVINYRLAPDHGWPAGRDDLLAAIGCLRTHATGHGGDPDRIVLAGTSAGATHVCATLSSAGGPPGVRGAILLSGLYGITPLSTRDMSYYGPQDLYAARRPLDGVAATTLPLLVAGAEYDPPRFQQELLGLLAARLDRHGKLPRCAIAGGHNHFSLAAHLGTDDTRLAEEMLAFIADVAGPLQEPRA